MKRSIVQCWIISAAIFLSLSSAVKGGDSTAVRVRILNSHHPRAVSISAESVRVFLPETVEENVTKISLSAENGRINLAFRGKALSLESVRIESPLFRVSFTDRKDEKIIRSYAGALDVSVQDGELFLINEINKDRYIHAAAAAELGVLLKKDPSASAGWEKELVAAMEIVVRSYCTAEADRHDDPRYQFCDLTHCVHFPGIRAGSLPLTKECILCDRRGSAVSAYFHSACGGVLTLPDVYWGRAAGDTYREGADSLSPWPVWGLSGTGEEKHTAALWAMGGPVRLPRGTRPRPLARRT
ncbi:MAG: hypothetical protein ACRCUT_11600 [Spirochaetota bacterium]